MSSRATSNRVEYIAAVRTILNGVKERNSLLRKWAYSKRTKANHSHCRLGE